MVDAFHAPAATANAQTSDVTKVTVSTVPPVAVPAGFIEVTARTRASTDKETGKKTVIAADQRSRSILIAEHTPKVEKKYLSLVLSALFNVAKQQLEAQWQANPDLREVDAALYREDSLLLYAAREAESKKLNGDAIAAWFKASALHAFLAAKYTAPQIAKMQKELEHLAAPVTSTEHYNEEKAQKRIVLLSKFPTDQDHEITAALINKLARFVEKIQKARAEIGDVADIEE